MKEKVTVIIDIPRNILRNVYVVYVKKLRNVFRVLDAHSNNGRHKSEWSKRVKTRCSYWHNFEEGVVLSFGNRIVILRILVDLCDV